jgi:hypothetical protein
MLLDRTSTAIVTSTEAPVFTISGPNAEGQAIFLENLDTVNYISYRVQTANSNVPSAFTDLPSDSVAGGVAGNYGCSGTLTPINPSVITNRVMVNVRTSASYLRLVASSSGGAQLNYGIVTIGPSTSTTFTNGTL